MQRVKERERGQAGPAEMIDLKEKFADRSAVVSVIGLGQVGLSLALELAQAGFFVWAHDTSKSRLDVLAQGRSYLSNVPHERVRSFVDEGRLCVAEADDCLVKSQAIVLCVPTPLTDQREPQLSFLKSACETIARHVRKQTLVVVESTTYPGVTQDVLLPLLESSGLVVGRDLYLAFSPERVDPGNPQFHIKNTAKVISGATPRCLEMIAAFYGEVMDQLVPVSSTQAAETVKLLENTFRAVNIALVNEISLAARKMGVDPFEVVQAAATKPFGFMPFYPGPGLGGHCIPIDPLYLSYKLRELDHEPRLIAAADAINRDMPQHVLGRATELLAQQKKGLRGCRTLVYGVAYKPDIDDTRESPSLEILALLQASGAKVSFSDPYVPELRIAETLIQRAPVDGSFAAFDLVIVATNHSQLPRARMLREARLILDTRGAFRGQKNGTSKVFSL